MSVNQKMIDNLSAPTDDDQAVNKKYVDDKMNEQKYMKK